MKVRAGKKNLRIAFYDSKANHIKSIAIPDVIANSFSNEIKVAFASLTPEEQSEIKSGIIDLMGIFEIDE